MRHPVQEEQGIGVYRTIDRCGQLNASIIYRDIGHFFPDFWTSKLRRDSHVGRKFVLVLMDHFAR